MGPTALLPLRRKACWGFFRPEKSWRLWLGLNPRTWVLKGSTLPLDHQSRLRPLGFQDFEDLRFPDNWHVMLGRLSTLCTGHLYPPGNITGGHFCDRLSQLQGHSAARKIKSMKNSSDMIRNRTRDLPVCSAVPQPCHHVPPAQQSSRGKWQSIVVR